MVNLATLTGCIQGFSNTSLKTMTAEIGCLFVKNHNPEQGCSSLNKLNLKRLGQGELTSGPSYQSRCRGTLMTF
jgi:hypothetical protein